MKRNIPFVLVLLFVASTNSLAQQPNAAEAVFDKWRQAAPADEVSRLGFALAAVARRTSAEVAELDLWASRGAPEVVVEVQPLYFEKLPNGEYRWEQAGAFNKTTIGGADGQNVAGDKVGLKMILPVSPNANSLVIKWVSYGGGRILNSTTVEVLLKDEPSESLTRITASR
jgi:hypothetical protein